jgi:hypothetical protein
VGRSVLTMMTLMMMMVMKLMKLMMMMMMMMMGIIFYKHIYSTQQSAYPNDYDDLDHRLQDNTLDRH